MFYLFSGGIFLYLSEFILAFSKSFGFKIGLIEAEYFSISFLGRMGRSTKLPAQLGHTFLKISSAHALQYVHSKEHIIASVDVFGKSLLQCSQLGLISSIL